MTDILVVGQSGCHGADDESDEWIPLKVSWRLRRTGQPLYLRVSGNAGGEVELKVDRTSGALLQALVIDPAMPAAAPTATPALTSRTSQTAVLDRSLWDDRSSVVKLTADLAFAQAPESAELSFSPRPATRYLSADDVTIGVSDESTLVSIRTERKVLR